MAAQGAESVAPDSNATDPFNLTPTGRTSGHRYSSFDTKLFSSYTRGSPTQAKRALEAHIADTDRRIQNASTLGTTLLEQKKELAARLKDVEQQQGKAEIDPELEKKLAELEKDYNDVGRETARAFIPKSTTKVDSDLLTATLPLVSNGENDQSSSNSQANSRRQRNQPANRVHNVEFLTEISTSLVTQVRNLQVILAQKEEAIKNSNAIHSQLQSDLEHANQRLHGLDDNEQKYKDENWTLETQVQDLTAQIKDAQDKERKHLQILNVAKAEKAVSEKEHDELKQLHGKLTDDHNRLQKQHDTEINGLRRNVSAGDNERETLQKKIDELTSHNQELAGAFAYRMKTEQDTANGDEVAENGENEVQVETPEHSPPPSPIKATPRHGGGLESETLKSSLHHAHRMIQTLKNNIHREKTEKIELKRLLQDARDEVENKRTDAGVSAANAGKKRKPATTDVFKKPARPTKLGDLRNPQHEILHDSSWEDHDTSPTRKPAAITVEDRTTDTSDAFETANEQDTTDYEFHTGAESIAGDSSDDLTETEADHKAKRTGQVPKGVGNRSSFISTASDENDQYDLNTPVRQPRYKLKVNRGGFRHSSETPTGNDSPASFRDSPASFKDSPASFISDRSQEGSAMNLAAELGNLDDEESIANSTPSRSATVSQAATPQPRAGREEKMTPTMVDSATLTDPWTPKSDANKGAVAASFAAGGAVVGGLASQLFEATKDAFSGSSEKVQDQDDDDDEKASTTSTIEAPPASTLRKSSIGDDVSQTIPLSLSLSAISVQQTEPIEPQILATTDVQKSFAGQSTLLGHSKSAFPVSSGALSTVSNDINSVRPSDETAATGDSRTRALVYHAPFDQKPVIQHQNINPATVSTEKTSKLPTTTEIFNNQLEQSTSSPVEKAINQAGFVEGMTKESTGVHDPPPFTISISGREVKPRKPKSTDDKEDMLPSFAIVKDENATGEFHEPTIQIADPFVDVNRKPFQPVSGNANVSSSSTRQATDMASLQEASKAITADGGTQTIISSEQIDILLKERNKKPMPGLPYGVYTPPPAARSTSQTRALSPSFKNGEFTPPIPGLSPKRPGSSGSMRKGTASPPPLEVPPLPADHKEVIAAASRTSSLLGNMGPPSLPTSALRQPSQTRSRSSSINHQQGPVKPPISTGVNNKPSSISGRSAMSRRSSVSSFASELDERFNIPAGGRGNAAANMDNYDMGAADPRMIQAITQTMIGEFLWKYTRKAGRGEISNNRHKRFFWIHPYTRTLYWSNQDPSTTGRTELRAKSVGIEAVRVVTDDNHIPPGLHNRSIVVLTPGRSIKFTAQTANRHDTWFNALSYLLLRGGPDRQNGANQQPQRYNNYSNTAPGGFRTSTMASFASEDLPDMNDRSTSRASRPSSISAKRSSMAPSMTASLVQRTPVRNGSTSTPAKPGQAQSRADGTGSELASPVKSHAVGKKALKEDFEFKKPDLPASATASPRRGSQSSSRFGSLSSKFRPTSGLFSSQRGRHPSREDDDLTSLNPPSIHARESVSVASSSRGDGNAIENVRACCDGKHDVGSLTHHHSSTSSRASIFQRPHGSRTNSSQQLPTDPANLAS